MFVFFSLKKNYPSIYQEWSIKPVPMWGGRQRENNSITEPPEPRDYPGDGTAALDNRFKWICGTQQRTGRGNLNQPPAYVNKKTFLINNLIRFVFGGCVVVQQKRAAAAAKQVKETSATEI